MTDSSLRTDELAPLPAEPLRPRLRGVLHQWAFAAFSGGCVALVITADSARARIAAVIYAMSVVGLFGTSALYHRRSWSQRARRWMRRLDHSMIFILIAGTYTPFTLGVLRGPWGWALLGTIWGLALLGITAKCTLGFRFPRLSTLLYLAMGWLVLVGLQPLVARVAPAGIAWLVAGGLCYTGGVVFYAMDGRLRYSHALWHVFVMAGSVCHVLAVLWHAAPRQG